MNAGKNEELFEKLFRENFDFESPIDNGYRMGYLAAMADTLHHYIPESDQNREFLAKQYCDSILEWHKK